MDVTALRGDGRRGHEVRRIDCAFGVLDDCDGSALLTQGLTKVIATVNGPREVARKTEAMHDRAIVRCEVSQAAFSTTERRRRRAGDRKATGIAAFVEETFTHVIQTTLFKKCEIDITLHVLQADGGVVPACINATALALTHAGIPMVDLVTCCSIGFADGTMMLDLNHQEESSGGPQLLLTLMPRTSQVLTLKMETRSSRVNTTLLDKMVQEAQVGCHLINKILDAKLREMVADALRARQAADVQ